MGYITGIFFVDIFIGFLFVVGYAFIIVKIFKDGIGIPEFDNLTRSVVICSIAMFIVGVLLTVLLGLPIVLGGVGTIFAGIIAYYQLRRSFYEVDADAPLIQEQIPFDDYFKTKSLLKWVIIMNIIMFCMAIVYSGSVISHAQKKELDKIEALTKWPDRGGSSTYYDSRTEMEIIKEENIGIKTLVLLFLLTTGGTIFLLPHLQTYYVIDTTEEQKEEENIEEETQSE